ncbi:MAG: hypothetical protein ACRDQH_16185, partial [Pseudonocardiaceae bacterium]
AHAANADLIEHPVVTGDQLTHVDMQSPPFAPSLRTARSIPDRGPDYRAGARSARPTELSPASPWSAPLRLG